MAVEWFLRILAAEALAIGLLIPSYAVACRVLSSARRSLRLAGAAVVALALCSVAFHLLLSLGLFRPWAALILFALLTGSGLALVPPRALWSSFLGDLRPLLPEPESWTFPCASTSASSLIFLAQTTPSMSRMPSLTATTHRPSLEYTLSMSPTNLSIVNGLSGR